MRESEEKLPREIQDHAWFACYAPVKNPEIALAVLVEHGGHGGESAAPVARAILDAFFSSKQEKQGPEQADAGRHVAGTGPLDHASRLSVEP
jgi:cell division protein FtsI/penicillin-binding protein 2